MGSGNGCRAQPWAVGAVVEDSRELVRSGLCRGRRDAIYEKNLRCLEMRKVFLINTVPE